MEQLGDGNKYKTEILDVGCGNGYVGLYLKQLGFIRIYGSDCSRIKIKEAEKKKCYEELSRCTFGLKDSVIPE